MGYDKKKSQLILFMEKYDIALELSEGEYGVPKELTAAIIGVESVYGTITGRHLAANIHVCQELPSEMGARAARRAPQVFPKTQVRYL